MSHLLKVEVKVNTSRAIKGKESETEAQMIKEKECLKEIGRARQR